MTNDAAPRDTPGNKNRSDASPKKRRAKPGAKPDAKAKLLDAALRVIRQKGYAGASVDDLCAEAGVTKGAFFHHFKTKDALAVAAADYWSEMTGALFAGADYHHPEDPLDRLLAYIDFRKDLIDGGLEEFTCLVGTMTQETFLERPEIRNACARSIESHAETLEADISGAFTKYAVNNAGTPKSLALHTQAVIQGAFILAKAKNDANAARDSIDHLRRYVELIFRKKGV